nr:bifunctional glucokinase/RpiR family transcriptionalregulator [Candidatus Pantoea persica]
MRVYQYIIKHPESFSYMTIRELAERADVSTTVLHFCRKMHYDGWSEFRVRFRLAQQPKAPVQANVGVGEMLSFFTALITQNSAILSPARRRKLIRRSSSFLLAPALPAAWLNMARAFFPT